MTRIIDFTDGFTSSTEPTTEGSIASFLESFANTTVYSAKYTAQAGSAFYDSTEGVIKFYDGSTWRVGEKALDNSTTSDPAVTDDSDSGYTIYSLWLNTSSGAIFRCFDASVGAAVWTEIALDSVVDAHIAATAAHGATGAVVGTTNTQTLTNKTLTSADIDTPDIDGGTIDGSTINANTLTANDIDGGTASNSSRITVPKASKATLDGLTRKQATIVYASDEDKLYKDDGSALTEIGSGGTGTLDTFYQDAFEINDHTAFTSGNNATVDAAGTGTLDGTLATETTSHIREDQSIKYTMGSTSTNDFFLNDTDIALDLKQKGNFIGVSFWYTYDGADDDIRFFVLDQDDNELTDSTEYIKAASDATRFSTSFFLPNTDTGLRYGFQVVTGNNTKVFIFDDIELSTNPFVYKNINRENVFTAFINNNAGTPEVTAQNEEFISSITDNGTGDYTLNFTSGFFSVPPICVVNPAEDGGDRMGHVGVVTTTTAKIYMTESTSTPQDQDFTIIVQRNGTDYGQTTEHVVTPAKSTLTNFTTPETLTIEGVTTDPTKGTMATDEISIRQIGSEGEVKINFRQSTAGSAGSGDYLFTLPDGKSFKTGTTFYTGSNQVSHDADYFEGIQFAHGPGYAIADALVVPYDSTRFRLFIGSMMEDAGTGSGATLQYIGSAWKSFAATEFILKGKFSCPIEGFSSDATFLAAVPVQKVAYIKDVKSNGTSGGTFTSGAWQTRELNTVSGDSEIVSLSSNQFTLSSGKYLIEAKAPALFVDGHKAKLYNITDSTNDILGSNSYASSTENTLSVIEGTIEVTSSKVFEIQHRCNTTRATNGFGQSVSYSVDEIYTQVKITKIK